MTYATYIEDSVSGTAFLSVQGHAGYAEAGRDIVCSAISTLIQTLALYLSGNGIEAEVRQDEGEMHVKAPITTRSKDGFVFCLTGLRAVSEAYPDNLKLIFEKT